MTIGEVEKGKKLVICVIIISLLFEGFSILLNAVWGNGNVFRLTQSVVRFVLDCLLNYNLYKGYNWARVVSAILFGSAGIISLIFTFTFGWLMLVLGIPFVICAGILISNPVKAYQHYRRDGNTL